MNKNLHRILFNEHRGQFMVVAEVDASHGGAACESVAIRAPASSKLVTTVGAVSLACLCTIGSVVWLMPAPANAQVVAYRNAPATQQPTILQTSNGVPQVNIQTPSAAGVSRNLYSQFDVNSQGVILNNSRTNTQTQLGGWVQGNPWLATGSAKIILNEVYSSNPSYLNGYVEVAGQRAEVVIANPAGISVNGGGFINASKATLTTGATILNNGSLDGYRVQGGSVTVQGDGLDLTRTDYAAIVTRSVQVNASIWANELKLVTGVNEVDASTLGEGITPQATPQTATGTAPTYALDVAHLGGMYAGKITLVGTEAGVGVRNAGTLGASAGDLVLQANGLLTNTGTLRANGNAEIQTIGLANIKGSIASTANTQIATTEDVLNNDGLITASQTLNVQARNVSNTASAEISATQTQITANQALTNRGLIDGVNTQIKADALTTVGTGRIYGDDLQLTVGSLLNDTEIVAGVSTSATVAARNTLTVQAENVTNREHALLYSDGDMRMTVTDTLNNNSATIEAAHDMVLNAKKINNTNEHFSYEIRVASIDENARDDISSTYYRTYVQTIYMPFNTSSDPSNIVAGRNMSLNSDTVTNQNSHIILGGGLTYAGVNLVNADVTATKRVHNKGLNHNYVYVPQSGSCGFIKWNCVRAHYEWQTSAYEANEYSTVYAPQPVAYKASGYQSTSVTPGTVSNNALLPTSSMFKTNPNATSKYLVEADPRFANSKQWLGSDYMLQSLSLDPAVTQKRLGDGYYEQKLIREQVANLTGRRYLGDYTSDEQEYQALMDNAVTTAKALQLRPGIALSDAQVASLTSDIVWLVEKDVTLADGSTQKVLAPQLYVRPQPDDLQASGSLISANDINIKLSGDLNNSGTIAGRQVLSLNANNINNLNAIKGDAVSLQAQTDLNNVGGSISAISSLSATAGRDIKLQTTTSSSSTDVGANNFSRTTVDRVAGLYVSGDKGTLVASAGRDLEVKGAVISNAGSSSTDLSAGENFKLSSVTISSSDRDVWDADNYRKSSNSADVGSQIYGGGTVAITAGKTFSATAADVQASGALDVHAQDVQIQAGVKKTDFDEAHKATGKGLFSSTTVQSREISSSSTAVGSSFGGATVNLNASQDIKIEASSVEAQNALVLKAGRDVQVLSGLDEQRSLSYSKTEKQTTGIAATVGRALGKANLLGDKMPGNPLQMGSLLLQSHGQDTNQTVQSQTSVRSSSLSGGTVDINSARDTTLKAAQVVADGAVNVQAGGQIQLQAAEQTQKSNANSSSDKSGLLSHKALSTSIGTSQQTQNEQQQGTTSVVTQIASLGKNSAGQTLANANVTLQAQDKISGEGASLLAPSGDISVQAQNIELLEARNSTTAASVQDSKTTANTMQVGSSLISTAQNLQRAKKLQDQSEQSGNSRTQSLAQLNTALSAYNAYNAASGGGSGSNPDTPTPTAGPTAGLTIGSSYGTSTSHAESQQSSATSTQGQVAAGGNITFKATGAGQDSNLTLQGQDVQAGGKVILAADNQVNLLAAQDTASQQSNNQSSASAVGATFALGGNQNGLSFQASANKALGKANGDSTTYNNTQVQAKQVQIDSGADTTLKGAVVKADQVTANVGGNLNIESLQDSATYTDKQSSSGVGVSICVPPFCLGQVAIVNVSAAKAKINSDYQSVTEQSGLKAGDGGFTVNVQGNTDLKGAAITSTQAAIDQNKNTFNTDGKLTTSDLENKASYEAKSVSVSISTGGGGAAGFGSDSGQASSTTKAAISGIAGDTAARTGDKEAGIKPIFDAQKVKADVQLQTAVTGEFGRNASKAVGDYATSQLKKAQDANDPAGIEAWREGGSARVALHAAVGGLTGGVAGAAGAGTSQAVIDQVGQALKNTDLPLELKRALVAAAGTAVGMAVSGGSVAGGATAFNATANNYLTHAQLQSKQQQLAACKDDACRKQVNSTWEKVSQAANARVEDKALQANVSDNLKAMNQLASDMGGLAQYKTGLEDQLRNTSDPTQRASLQLQINEADNNMRQIAGEGKTITALLYQQTGEAKYQNAFQALSAATSGNELGAALAIAGGSGGNVNKAVQETKSGAQLAQAAKINALADEAQAANTSLNKTNSATADSTYVAPTHTSDGKFQTHGLTTDQVPASIKNQMTKDLEATFGAGAKDKAIELIESGRSVPVPMQATSDTKLYKLVPDNSAYGPKPDSPYFVDAAQLQRLQKNPSLANDILGLPPSSQAPVFKVYEVQPQPNTTPTVYQSDVATATNKAGSAVVGNATQTLVPDRSLWTEPKLTNINIGGK